MNKVLKYVKFFLMLLSLSALVVLVLPRETYKDFGKIAWDLLIVVMIIRPLSDIFPKCKILKFIFRIRRQLGILVAIFGIAHTIGALILYMDSTNHTKTYFEIMLEPYMWTYNKLLFGMLAFLVSLPLLISSNGIFTSLLGKHWKTLQRLSYFMFIFVALHIYFLKKGRFGIIPLIILLVWIALYAFAHLKKSMSSQKVSQKSKKWLCVPCAYIYDEAVGDPDSGIQAGTRFEDIPEDWRCPICGVTKKDFILLEGIVEKNEAEIVSLTYLTFDVIELKLDVKRDLAYTSGQFLTFALKDKKGDFNRSYSIAYKEGNIFTFLIKLKTDGRAGILLRTKKLGNMIAYTNISGEFTLKSTLSPKVFIATGTGLAPIYSMCMNTPGEVSKKLYFGVANFKDMFYVDNIKKIANLESNFYLSREQVEGYNFGRINLEDKQFDINTEFYICGNPGLVASIKEFLGKKGFTQVFSEEF